MAGGDLPDMAAGLLGLGSAAEKQSIMRFATTTARDAAISVGNRKAGMLAYIDALGCWTEVRTDGGSWVISALGRSAYAADQSAGFTCTASFTDVTGCSITLPAGGWKVEATGIFDYATSSARLYIPELFDTASLGYQQIGIGTTGKLPFALQARVLYTSSTTVKLHAYASAVDGSQFLSYGRLTAVPVAY